MDSSSPTRLARAADPLDEHRRTARHKITAPEALDLSNAPTFSRTLCRAIDQTPDSIEVDMSRADFIDVAGWRVLLDAARHAACRAPLILSGLSERHRRTAELLGLAKALRRLERGH
jgi:anti-anti-sigma factor